MSLENLDNEFANLLASEIKELPKKINTLFDIARFSHYEDVISNFYAYYFNSSAEHGLTDLFSTAINNIIKRKTKYSIFVNVNLVAVEQEVCTANGKFIDIVLKELSSNGTTIENAVIIENKVYAPLYNDLLDYYNHIKVTNQKIGIVLSIRLEKNLPVSFINITHIELITEVEQSAGLYFINADPKHLIIFKEFIQNIKSLSMSENLSDQYDFYLKHEEKIRKIVKLRDAIVMDVFKQASLAYEKLNMGLELKAQYHSSLRYYVSSKVPVYFTIWLADFFTENESIGIFVELNEAGIKYLEVINEIDFTEEEREYIKETTRVRKSYLQYAVKYFGIDDEQFKNLGDFICDRITNTPLKSIFSKIESRLIEEMKSNQN